MAACSGTARAMKAGTTGMINKAQTIDQHNAWKVDMVDMTGRAMVVRSLMPKPNITNAEDALQLKTDPRT